MRGRPIRSWTLQFAFATGLWWLVLGCGKVGDPLPPLVSIPEVVDTFRVEQVGYELRFQWTNPSRNVDQSASIDLDRALISDGNTVVLEVEVTGPGQSQVAALPARDLVGATGEYTLHFETLEGRVSAASPTVSLTLVQVPGPVSSVRAIVDQNRIVLRWDTPSDGAQITDAYRVYRSGVAFPGPPQRETRFEDTRYQAGDAYTYTVVPLRQRGSDWIEGLASEPITVTALDLTPPVPPTELSLTPFQGGAFIRWQPSQEVDVVRYSVFRRDAPTGEFRRISGTNQTTTAFPDPEYQSGYVYAVTALDGSGNESLLSAPIGE